MSRRTKHLYEVWLKIEDRNDIREDFKTEYKLLTTTTSLEKTMDYIYVNRHLETQLDPYDDGSGWLHIKTLFYKRIR